MRNTNLFISFTDEEKEILRDYLSGKKNVALKSYTRAHNKEYAHYCETLFHGLRVIIEELSA